MHMHNLKPNLSMFSPIVNPLILVLITILSLTTLTKNALAITPNLNFSNNSNLQVANSACEGTLYPELCVSTLAKIPNLHAKSVSQIISATVNVTVSEVRSSAENCTRFRRSMPGLGPLEKGSLQDCQELLSYTLADLDTVLSILSKSPGKRYSDLQTLLSAAMTYQSTCIDGLAQSKKQNDVVLLSNGLDRISRHFSNALHMLKNIEKKTPSTSGDGGASTEDGFPKWMSRKDREFLIGPLRKIRIDVVVAKDGSGDFKSINKALEEAPDSSESRFVIYIKEGSYYEYVEVEKTKSMIMFLGDGIGQTRIMGNRNNADGTSTFRSATLTVVGNGFIARGITVENYAGPAKHQAVALRSDSDLSAFYDCSFLGYQDTLYVHSLRQFYRDCDVYGTVDFIFGNAAVVFQNCNIYARKPMKKQKNVITAQGRTDPSQTTGISILNCKIAASEELIDEDSVKSFLGRPWKKYSRTVVMLSKIGSLIDPAGWLEWDGNFALKTLYYGEYKNSGPGSDIEDRVTWPGYKVIKSKSEARQFTAGRFIDGADWLPDTKIPYYLGFTDDDEPS